jgi:hypothetical protein
MKKLLISLLFICNFATAGILATLNNQAGGVMYFTDAQCSQMGKSWRVVYSTYNGGQSSFGCWFYMDGMVHVQWNNGNTSAFEAKNLTINTNKGSY